MPAKKLARWPWGKESKRSKARIVQADTKYRSSNFVLNFGMIVLEFGYVDQCRTFLR